MKNLVSIIINCHNGEKFLSSCFESVLAQSYTNWELIFWDNISIDKSKEIFDQYNDPRFKYFKSQNFTNLTTARKLALKEAKGKFIAFLDTDDQWEKNKLENQINYLNQNKFLLIFSNFHIITNYKKKLAIKKDIPSGNLVNFFLKKYPVALSSIVFDNSILKKIQFNEKYHIIGDFDFVMKSSLMDYVTGIKEPLANILYHDQNETKKKFKLYILELIHWSKNCDKRFLKFKNFLDFKKNIYYQMSKYLIINKKYKSLLTCMKKLTFLQNSKLIIFLIFNLN